MCSNFVGALAHGPYAEDNVLSAPSESALNVQYLMSFAITALGDYSISSNASKSECLVVLPTWQHGSHR